MIILSKKNLATKVLILAALCATGTAQSAETADLTITGKIMPTSCDVSLDTPTVDFGEISWTQEGRSQAASKNVKLNVICDAATRSTVAIDYKDSEVGEGIDLGSTYASAQVALKSGRSEGTQNDVIVYTGNATDPTSKEQASPGDLFRKNTEWGFSEFTSGGRQVGTYDSYDFDMSVGLNFDTSLPAPQDIEELNGTATFTVKYY